MRPEGQIRHKLVQVRFRHLKREIRNGLSKRSSNCKYNGQIDLPGYERVGLCLYGATDPEQWNGGACDEVLGDRAARCPLFECVNSKEQIREDFNSFLESSDRAHVASKYPDMAALLWVLDLDKPGAMPVPEDGEDEGDVPPEPPAPVEAPPASVSPEETSGLSEETSEASGSSPPGLKIGSEIGGSAINLRPEEGSALVSTSSWGQLAIKLRLLWAAFVGVFRRG